MHATTKTTNVPENIQNHKFSSPVLIGCTRAISDKKLKYSQHKQQSEQVQAQTVTKTHYQYKQVSLTLHGISKL